MKSPLFFTTVLMAAMMMAVPSCSFSSNALSKRIALASRHHLPQPSPFTTSAVVMKPRMPSSVTTKTATSTTSTTSLHVAQYAGQAISLFNNMKTPASIIAGAIVPLGFLSPLQLKAEDDDTAWERRVRVLYQVLSVVTLATELIAVMWATVATNQLTETVVLPATSVWHLLQRDFALEWAAVNTHFVIGMLGFVAMIGSRAYFMAKKGLLGKSVLGIALSGLALMVSIVNRGVASGGGGAVTSLLDHSNRYGSSIVGLTRSYASLLLKRALCRKSFGPIELISVVTLVVSIGAALKAVWNADASDK